MKNSGTAEWWPGDPLFPEGWRRRVRIAVRLGLYGGFLLIVGVSLAYAQITTLNNCSQTVSTAAAAVVFPTAGGTGPPTPTNYLQICNAHASNTLGINYVRGGTAAIGSAGTLTLNPGGCAWWNANAVPGALSVIGSAASTTTACAYR